MDSDYLNIDDILSTSIKITCRMKHPVHKLGFIDPNGESENISKHVKLELPLWLAKEYHECDLANIELPKGFNELYRQVLQADPSVVNLQKLVPNYYRTGRYLSFMNIPESPFIAESLVNTFFYRIKKLMDYSTNATLSVTPEMSNFLRSLDNEERDIFVLAQKSFTEFCKWQNRSIEKVEANEMVTKLKNRKRVARELGE